MNARSLDGPNKKILALLQRDGRTTNVNIAKHANISPPPALRRTRALEKNGYILGYHAKLDAKKLGFDLTAYVLVKLVSQSKRDLDEFRQRALDWPTIRECYALSGLADFLLKCVARSHDDFQSFLSNELLKTPNIKFAKTARVVRTAKEFHGVPI